MQDLGKKMLEQHDSKRDVPMGELEKHTSKVLVDQIAPPTTKVNTDAMVARLVDEVKRLQAKRSPFYLHDGRVVQDPNALAQIAQSMSQQLFSEHVTPTRNDFAQWIADVFKDDELASRVRKTTTPTQLRDAIVRENRVFMPDAESVFATLGVANAPPDRKIEVVSEVLTSEIRQHLDELRREREAFHHVLSELRDLSSLLQQHGERITQVQAPPPSPPPKVFERQNLSRLIRDQEPEPEPVGERVEQLRAGILAAKAELHHGKLSEAWKRYSLLRDLFNESSDISPDVRRVMHNQLHELYTEIQLARLH